MSTNPGGLSQGLPSRGGGSQRCGPRFRRPGPRLKRHGIRPKCQGSRRTDRCLSTLGSLCLLLLALTLQGCGYEPPASAATGTRWDSAGMEVVEHGSLAEYDAPVYPVEYLVRVSGNHASEEETFGRVLDADLLPGGKLAVLDEHAAQVRVFSPDGTFLRAMGRKGPGPGELSGGLTLGMLVLPGGRLALPDLGNQAFVVFDSTGAHRENLPWDVMEETIPQWRVLSSDTVMALVTAEEQNAWVARTLAGHWRDTLAVRPPPLESPVPSEGLSPLLANHVLWSVEAPDRLAISQMSLPALTLFQEGRLTRVIRWEDDAGPLSEGETETLFRVAARGMGSADGDPALARRYFAAPDRVHAMADLELGSSLILVQRLRALEDMDERILRVFGAAGFGGPLWDAFSWSGSYLGVVDFGGNVELFRVRGDTLVGVLEDSLGVATPFVGRLPAELRQEGPVP